MKLLWAFFFVTMINLSWLWCGNTNYEQIYSRLRNISIFIGWNKVNVVVATTTTTNLFWFTICFSFFFKMGSTICSNKESKINRQRHILRRSSCTSKIVLIAFFGFLGLLFCCIYNQEVRVYWIYYISEIMIKKKGEEKRQRLKVIG